jgi:hypothetical protein
MSGLEILGAIAASIEVIKTVRSSLLFLNDARNVPKHLLQQQDMHFSLVVQMGEFESWCAAIGIPEFQHLQDHDITTGNLDAQRKLEVDLRLANTAVAKATLGSVLRLKDKFAEASNILISHDAALGEPQTPTMAPSDDKQKHNTVSIPEKKKRFAFLSRHKQDEYRMDVDTVSETRSLKSVHAVTKSFQWVAIDRKAFATLLGDIKRVNEDLMMLLEQRQRRQAHRQAQMAILNEPFSRSDNIQGLSENDELTALVKMRTLQEENNQGLPGAAISKRPRINHYRAEEFQGHVIKAGDTRSICQLEETTVLVEWKFYSKESPIRAAQMERLGDLARLLNEKEIFKKFLAPGCKGLVNDKDNSRVGIVFELSVASDAQVRGSPRLRDLQALIRETSAHSSTIPPLGARFEMARKLALAMHNLHSVEWLHKSFRSDNIVFLENSTTKPLIKDGANSRGEQQSQYEANDNLGEIHLAERLSSASQPSAMHLVGWDLSRPDTSSALSESNSLMGFQSQRQNIKLYSHPDAYATSSTKLRYRAQFDMYSLGLVLLEIGLWRTLDMIRKKCTSDEDFRAQLKYEWCDKLLPRMGTVYWRATQRCLFGDFDITIPEEGTGSNYALKKAFQRLVVSKLEECFA